MTGITLTANEKTCCILLSDLFLDCPPTSIEYNYIADRLRDLNMPLDEIRNIFYYDVLPALSLNLISVAGEWAMFDPEIVYARVESSRAFPRLFTYITTRLYWAIFSSAMTPHWNEIERRLLGIIKEPEPGPCLVEEDVD